MATAAVQSQTVVLVKDANVPAIIKKSEVAKAYIAPLLPKGVTLDEVAAKVRLALAKDTTGALQKCTVGSVILSVAKICGWGLEIGSTAHLVPFGTECTALRDYTGDIQLAIESGMVRRVSAQVVYANEPFKLVRGTRTEIEHHPIADPSQRGALVGAYAIVHVRGNDIEVEYRTVGEVDEIRQKHSKQWKGGAVPRWYMIKTVVRQALKLIPKSPKMRELLAVLDDEGELGGVEEIDAAIASLPPQTQDEGEERPQAYRPRALVGSGEDPYTEAPIPPQQFADAPALTAEETEDASDELPLGDDLAPVRPRRRDALRES